MTTPHSACLAALPEKIKDARDARGMSQTELGLAIGQDKTAVSKFENGTRMPNLYTLGAISDALDVPLAAWFSDESLDARVGALPPEKRAAVAAIVENALTLAEKP